VKRSKTPDFFQPASLDEKKSIQILQPVVALLSYGEVLKLREKESSEYKEKHRTMTEDTLFEIKENVEKSQQEIDKLSREIQEIEKLEVEQKSNSDKRLSELPDKRKKQKRLEELQKYIEDFKSPKARVREYVTAYWATNKTELPEAQSKSLYYLKFTHEDQFFYLKKRGATSIDTGWKIHIAIDDSSNENVSRAWNTVLPLLISHDVETVKMTMPEVKFTNHPNNYGKQITLYHIPGVNWRELLSKIEKALDDAKIVADRGPLSDKRLSGSKYLFYRNDVVDYENSKFSKAQRDYLKKMQEDSGGSMPKGYIPATKAREWFDDATAYNPLGVPCPIADIHVTVEKMPLELESSHPPVQQQKAYDESDRCCGCRIS